ncbi:MAG: hypothetical protein ACR2FM_00720 [Candidatus Saccharimonadales bacterium]
MNQPNSLYRHNSAPAANVSQSLRNLGGLALERTLALSMEKAFMATIRTGAALIVAKEAVADSYQHHFDGSDESRNS